MGARAADWLAYYTEKRIVHQWMQVNILAGLDCRRVLEVGPALGLVTAMLANAGYQVETLDRAPRAFLSPEIRHIEADIRSIAAADISGFDAILCCETLEHIDWSAIPGVLQVFHASGARYLVVSVPYMEFQVTFDMYLNARTIRQYFSLKKLLHRKEFSREPPGGHQWEVGYRGYPLKRWEALLERCGWKIRRREFTAHTRSVFHLLERA